MENISRSPRTYLIIVLLCALLLHVSILLILLVINHDLLPFGRFEQQHRNQAQVIMQQMLQSPVPAQSIPHTPPQQTLSTSMPQHTTFSCSSDVDPIVADTNTPGSGLASSQPTNLKNTADISAHETSKQKPPTKQRAQEGEETDNQESSENEGISSGLEKEIIPSSVTMPTSTLLSRQKFGSRSDKQTKPLLTLAQLAAGFQKHMEAEKSFSVQPYQHGGGPYASSARTQAKMTEDSLKHYRFLKKVLDVIQTSWRASASRYPLGYPVIVNISFVFVLAKNGSLEKIELLESSGNYQIDLFVLNIVREASKGFPPIPDYLNINNCRIECPWHGLPLPDGAPHYNISSL